MMDTAGAEAQPFEFPRLSTHQCAQVASPVNYAEQTCGTTPGKSQRRIPVPPHFEHSFPTPNFVPVRSTRPLSQSHSRPLNVRYPVPSHFGQSTTGPSFPAMIPELTHRAQALYPASILRSRSFVRCSMSSTGSVRPPLGLGFWYTRRPPPKTSRTTTPPMIHAFGPVPRVLAGATVLRELFLPICFEPPT